MRKLQSQGVHHITLVGADRQTSIDFWEGVLGMPFIFEQPNLDRPSESHLYFDPGDGRLITVFTNDERAVDPGRTPTDAGCVHHIAFAVSKASFDQAVPNSSDAFDYYQNNAGRLTTATGVTREVQARPGAIDHHPAQELVVLPAPGQVLLFSGAQLHKSIPNTSGRARYSVDFRTVYAPDLTAGRGAPLVDVYCTGTSVRDFVNVADGSRFDEETVVKLFGAPPADAMLVYGSPGED